MAQSQTDIKARYPLPVYNYRVAILLGGLAGLPAGAQLTDLAGGFSLISCSEVSGLKMEVSTVTYRHGFSFLAGFHIVPGLPQEVKLSIHKGVTLNGQYLSDWMKLSYPFVQPIPASLARKRDLLIDLCDEAGLPVIRWKVLKAMPISLEAPSFKADTNEVAFEKLDLIAHELQVEYNP